MIERGFLNPVKAAAIFGRAKVFYLGCSFSLLSTASKPSGACHPMWQSGPSLQDRTQKFSKGWEVFGYQNVYGSFHKIANSKKRWRTGRGAVGAYVRLPTARDTYAQGFNKLGIVPVPLLKPDRWAGKLSMKDASLRVLVQGIYL